MNATPTNFFEFEAVSTSKNINKTLDDKKSLLRAIQRRREDLIAIQRRRDDLAAEIGYRVRDTISSYPLWVMEQVNFDDPRLADIKGKFFKTEEKLRELTWEVDRLEAIRDGELPRHEAKVKVYEFLRGMGDDKNQINFLQSYHLSTTSLTEAVLICPHLLEDMANFEENLEIIRSQPGVWW